MPILHLSSKQPNRDKATALELMVEELREMAKQATKFRYYQYPEDDIEAVKRLRWALNGYRSARSLFVACQLELLALTNYELPVVIAMQGQTDAMARTSLLPDNMHGLMQNESETTRLLWNKMLENSSDEEMAVPIRRERAKDLLTDAAQMTRLFVVIFKEEALRSREKALAATRSRFATCQTVFVDDNVVIRGSRVILKHPSDGKVNAEEAFAEAEASLAAFSRECSSLAHGLHSVDVANDNQVSTTLDPVPNLLVCCMAELWDAMQRLASIITRMGERLCFVNYNDGRVRTVTGPVPFFTEDVARLRSAPLTGLIRSGAIELRAPELLLRVPMSALVKGSARTQAQWEEGRAWARENLDPMIPGYAMQPRNKKNTPDEQEGGDAPLFV